MRISDWSSDVCSSDLPRSYAMQVAKSVFLQTLRKNKVISIGSILDLAALGDVDDAPGPEQHAHGQRELRRVEAAIGELGRASCRERVWQYGEFWGVDGTLKKTNNKKHIDQTKR